MTEAIPMESTSGWSHHPSMTSSADGRETGTCLECGTKKNKMKIPAVLKSLQETDQTERNSTTKLRYPSSATGITHRRQYQWVLKTLQP